MSEAPLSSDIALFMDRLAALDIKLSLEGAGLRCNAPQGALTADIKSELASRKPDIIEFLKRNATTPRPANQAPITPVIRDRPLPLSFAQQRIWSLSALHPDTTVYNMATAYRLRGVLDVAALEKSIGEVRNRHDILRTSFPLVDSQPIQDVAPATPFTLPIIDLSSPSGGTREVAATEWMVADIQRPFNLSTGPLWRVHLLKLSPDDHFLFFVMHHIMFDGWSKKVMLEEISTCYRAFSQGEAPRQQPLRIQFGDFSTWHHAWLKSEDAARQRARWEKNLSGTITELMVPSDRARPRVQTNASGNQTFILAPPLVKAIMELSRREEASLFMTLLAAYNLLLHRYSGQTDLVLCTPVACRNKVETERMIGYFNNIVVMRTDLSGDPSLREVIARVRTSTLSVAEHQDLPFQLVTEIPGLIRTPLTRGMFSLRNTSAQLLDLPGITTEVRDIRKRMADFDIAMYMQQRGDTLGGVVEFNTDLFDAPTVSDFLTQFQGMLDAMVTNPDLRVSGLSPLGRQEKDVEAILAALPQVEEAAVVVQKGNTHVQSRIAYIVPNQDDIPDHDTLRQHLKQRLPDYLVPFVFVPLNRMPLTADGNVDREALPPPPATRSGIGGLYVEPRTSLERDLATIWKRVLWLDWEVGIRDNFFDLGGHSLLSVQLFTEIEKLLQCKLSVGTLRHLSTIEELAATLEKEKGQQGTSGASGGHDVKLDQDARALLERTGLSAEIYHGLLAHTAGWQDKGVRSRPDSLLIGLNTASPAQILFWCSQGFHELSQLSRYLGVDQPLYGMRSGHRIMEKTEENENALAAVYVEEILSIQTQGPYLIGGNCQSARIAFKMASRLMEMGHHITLLCLQERFIPQPYPGRVTVLYGNDSDRNPFHYFAQPQLAWKKFYTGPMSVHIIPGKHGEFFREPNIQIIAEKIQEEIAQAKREEMNDRKTIKPRTGPLLPAQACRATLSVQSHLVAAPGTETHVKVRVTNTSTIPWPAGEQGRLTLGYRCFDFTARILLSLEPGTPLPHVVAPGESIHLPLTLYMPNKPGLYVFELDMVDNGTAFFKAQGSEAARINVFVRNGHRFANSLLTVAAIIRARVSPRRT